MWGGRREMRHVGWDIVLSKLCTRTLSIYVIFLYTSHIRSFDFDIGLRIVVVVLVFIPSTHSIYLYYQDYFAPLSTLHVYFVRCIHLSISPTLSVS